MTEVRSVPLRGAIECFYGRPWSHTDRHTVIVESARWGMNCFVYGPSGDPHTGAAWREPYDADDLHRFARLATIAADVGVSLGWRVSASAPLCPERGIAFSDEGQRRQLVERVSDMVDVGFRHIMLTFDDVDRGLFHTVDQAEFAGSPSPAAAAHARLATELAAQLADTPAELVVCPTRYWGVDLPDYLRALDAAVPSNVAFAWTGPRVSSRVVGADAPARRFRSRPVWLWDNYPVNDWDGPDAAGSEPAQRRLFLDPVGGRAAELTARLAGYFVNCGASAQASLPVLATAARWATDAGAYDGSRAIAEAIGAYDDEHGSLAFLRTAGCSTPLSSRAPHPVVARSWAFLGASARARSAEGPALAADLTALAARADAATRSAAPVVHALRWYAEQLALQLRAAAQAVAALTAEAVGDDAALAGPAQWLAERRDQLDRLMGSAVLDGGLLPLIETGRGVAGPPIPPHDV